MGARDSRKRRWPSLAAILVGLVLGCSGSGHRGTAEVAGPSEAAPEASATDQRGTGEDEPSAEAGALPPIIERIRGDYVYEYIPRKATIGDGTFSVHEPPPHDEVPIRGTYVVVDADDWSVTVDYQAAGQSSRAKLWILDDGHLYVQYARGWRWKPVGRLLAHGDGGALRQQLLERLQGAWSSPEPSAWSFTIDGTSARAEVEGKTHSGTLSVRAVSTDLLVVDLVSDSGERWIAAFVFQPDGSVVVDLKAPEAGWPSLGGGSFTRSH